MGDEHSVHHNIFLGVALPTPSGSVGPHPASSGFRCNDQSEMWGYHLNSHVELNYHGKYHTPLHAVVDQTYMSGYNSNV
jgi:hypothetical protein